MISQNLLSHFINTCQKYPDSRALEYEGGHYTWSELNLLSNQLAWSLTQLGVAPGHHVAVFLPNIPETIIAFLGILKAGAVHVSMSASLKSNAVRQILENSRPRVLITTQSLKEQVPQDLPFLQTVLAMDSSLDSFLDGSSAAPILWPVSPDQLALILYTSGTTGIPKGVTHSHRGLMANMKNFARCIGINHQDRILWFLPLSHAYALNAVLGVCFYTGATLYLLPDFQSEKVIQWIATHSITMIFGVPANYAMLKNGNSQMDTVRLFYSSGASLPIPLSRDWEARFGRRIHQSYGLSECGICTFQYGDAYEHGSLGRVIHPMEIKVVDPESGVEQPLGQQGELVIRGPNIMRGYWKRPEENAAALRNGWYHSGDIGVCDNEGHFQLLDRLKLVINIGGYKVIPAEVENVLIQHSAVEDVAVFGAPDPVLGEQVCAAVIPSSSQTLDESQLIAFCASQLASYKVPGKIVLVDVIPRTALGKMQKHLLKQPATVGDSKIPPLSYQQTTSWISQWLTPRLDPSLAPLSLNSSFHELGLDSVQGVTMVHELNTQLGTSEEATILWRFSTIHALANYLTQPPEPEPDELETLSHEQLMARLKQGLGEDP